VRSQFQEDESEATLEPSLGKRERAIAPSRRRYDQRWTRSGSLRISRQSRLLDFDENDALGHGIPIFGSDTEIAGQAI